MSIYKHISKKKIILYGSKKIQEDFKYLYSQLDIAEDNVPRKGNQFFTIICEKDHDERFKKYTQGQNLEYGIDYLYIRDFFLYYNPMFLERGDRKLAVWGTGAAADELWKAMDKKGFSSEIDFFIDNKKTQDSFKGRMVFSPEEIKNKNDIYIIVATNRYQWDIYRQLNEYGLHLGQDYIHCTTVVKDYNSLLEKVCFTESKYRFSCERPMGYCDVIYDNLYLCCPDYMPVSAGSMSSEPFMGGWNSYVARILRLSVLNGTFAFCDKQYCDLFDFDIEEKKQSINIFNYKKSYSKYPNTLMVGIDYSCNLRCPSCREKVCVADLKERSEINRRAEDLLEHVIPYVGRLWIAGSGEVFFSKTYRQMIEDERCIKRSKISFLSNGTLFDEETWDWVEKNYEAIEVVISMDGIKDQTIEKLRRGAKAAVLKKNLEFLGKLRKQNRLLRLFVSCVLQAENVAEIYDLLQYCSNIGVDKVQFLKLKNNGVYTNGERFDEMSIFDSNDCLKEEFMPYFTERLLHHPLADWFNNAKALQVDKKPRLDRYDTL